MAKSYIDNLHEMRAQIVAEHEQTLKSIDSLISRFGTSEVVVNTNANAASTTSSLPTATTGAKRGRKPKSEATATVKTAEVKPAKAKKGKVAEAKIRLTMSDVIAFTHSQLNAEPKTKNVIAAKYAEVNGLAPEHLSQIERGVYMVLMDMEKKGQVKTVKDTADARIKLYSK